jgi:hypothetical protein
VGGAGVEAAAQASIDVNVSNSETFTTVDLSTRID